MGVNQLPAWLVLAGYTASAAELNQLDGNILNDLATTAGTGITSAATASCTSSVEKAGALYKTTIVIDMNGFHTSVTPGDIIGDTGAANCHIGQITAARNGTIFAGSITCLEAPSGGTDDIDLYTATEATGTQSAAIGDLTSAQLIDAGAHAANAIKGLTAFPAAADSYLYLVAGGASAGDYTAGILVIELWGK